jgi:hypothetical protein
VSAEEPLRQNDPADVDCGQREREQAVDEGAVDDPVYVVEAVAEDGEAGRDGDGGGHDEAERVGEGLEGGAPSGRPSITNVHESVRAAA